MIIARIIENSTIGTISEYVIKAWFNDGSHKPLVEDKIYLTTDGFQLKNIYTDNHVLSDADENQIMDYVGEFEFIEANDREFPSDDDFDNWSEADTER